MHVCVHRESGSVVVWIFTKLSGSVVKLHLGSYLLKFWKLELYVLLPRQFGYKVAKSTLLYTMQFAYYGN